MSSLKKIVLTFLWFLLFAACASHSAREPASHDARAEVITEPTKGDSTCEEQLSIFLKLANLDENKLVVATLKKRAI